MDVIAVSIARYATIAKDWLLLPHGASIGRGYGPVGVAKEATPLEALRGKRIGIPGLRTTAYATLRLLLPEFEPIVIPIQNRTRGSSNIGRLRAKEVDAALLIHEGRLTIEREGFAKVCDVGEGWLKLTGLPLPLGGNAIRRGLGPELVARVSEICGRSIAWSLAHRDEVMSALLAEETRADVKLDRAMLDRYLTMYANEDTRSTPDDARRAVGELFRRARAAGIFGGVAEPEFAP